MSILDSLENLQVSEECFNSILDIVEGILLESDSNGIKVGSAGSVEATGDFPKKQHEYKPMAKKQKEGSPSFVEVLKNAQPSKNSKLLDK